MRKSSPAEVKGVAATKGLKERTPRCDLAGGHMMVLIAAILKLATCLLDPSSGSSLTRLYFTI
jgi:hypothetical protein